MSISRRGFLGGTGAAVLGAAAGVGGVAALAEAQEIVFSTLASSLDYEIEQGRVNDINIFQRTPVLPPFAPAETQIDYGNLVIKYDMRWVQSDIRTPNFLRLTLFRPRSSVSDLSTIFTPPSYVGHGPAGNYTLRYPAGNNTAPVREDTPLWDDYIAPNWEVAPGPAFAFNDLVTAAERDNTQWPGARGSSMFNWTGNFGLFPSVVPLRVAREGILREGELLLTLLEIRRLGRLRLMARTLWPKPVIARNCFGASVSSLERSRELMALREWRDQTLMASRLGRAAVRAYYGASPYMSDIVRRVPMLRPPSQRMVSLVARYARG